MPLATCHYLLILCLPVATVGLTVLPYWTFNTTYQGKTDVYGTLSLPAPNGSWVLTDGYQVGHGGEWVHMRAYVSPDGSAQRYYHTSHSFFHTQGVGVGRDSFLYYQKAEGRNFTLTLYNSMGVVTQEMVAGELQEMGCRTGTGKDTIRLALRWWVYRRDSGRVLMGLTCPSGKASSVLALRLGEGGELEATVAFGPLGHGGVAGTTNCSWAPAWREGANATQQVDSGVCDSLGGALWSAQNGDGVKGGAWDLGPPSGNVPAKSVPLAFGPLPFGTMGVWYRDQQGESWLGISEIRPPTTWNRMKGPTGLFPGGASSANFMVTVGSTLYLGQSSPAGKAWSLRLCYANLTKSNADGQTVATFCSPQQCKHLYMPQHLSPVREGWVVNGLPPSQVARPHPHLFTLFAQLNTTCSPYMGSFFSFYLDNQGHVQSQDFNLLQSRRGICGDTVEARMSQGGPGRKPTALLCTLKAGICSEYHVPAVTD